MLRHGHRVERGCSCSGSAVIFYQLCTHVCQFMRFGAVTFSIRDNSAARRGTRPPHVLYT